MHYRHNPIFHFSITLALQSAVSKLHGDFQTCTPDHMTPQWTGMLNGLKVPRTDETPRRYISPAVFSTTVSRHELAKIANAANDPRITLDNYCLSFPNVRHNPIMTLNTLARQLSLFFFCSFLIFELSLVE